MYQSFIAVYYTHVIYKSFKNTNLKDTLKQRIKFTHLSYKNKNKK